MAETNRPGKKARAYMMSQIIEHWKFFEKGDFQMLWNCVGFAMEEDGHRGHQPHDEVCQPYYHLAIKMISCRYEVLN